MAQKTPVEFIQFGAKQYLSTFLIIIGVMIFMDGFVSVGAGEAGVVFDRGRGVIQQPLGEGLHIKIPFWQIVDIYSVRTREYTMSKIAGEGSINGDDAITARSRDGQEVFIDATILHRISPADAPKIKQTLGSQRDYDNIVIRPISRSVVREVVANFDALDLVSEKRIDVVDNMNTRLSEEFIERGITLDEVVLRNVTFSAQFSAALEEKQVASEQVKTAEFQKAKALQVKEKKIIEAEAEAEAITLTGEALSAYPQVIQLQFVEKMADDVNWGILPNDAVPFLDLKAMQGQ
jgi:prohibitin 2